MENQRRLLRDTTGTPWDTDNDAVTPIAYLNPGSSSNCGRSYIYELLYNYELYYRMLFYNESSFNVK